MIVCNGFVKTLALSLGRYSCSLLAGCVLWMRPERWGAVGGVPRRCCCCVLGCSPRASGCRVRIEARAAAGDGCWWLHRLAVWLFGHPCGQGPGIGAPFAVTTSSEVASLTRVSTGPGHSAIVSQVLSAKRKNACLHTRSHSIALDRRPSHRSRSMCSRWWAGARKDCIVTRPHSLPAHHRIC